MRNVSELDHEGGCLCSAVRYVTHGNPTRVTICHCRFCQRATGSAYMVEPIFPLENFRFTRDMPSAFTLRSVGSGKRVNVHFCAACGTKLRLTFERWPEICGVYAGTFDDPDWFSISAKNSRHIFLDAARHDTIMPAGIPLFHEHAMRLDGTPQQAEVLTQPRAASAPD